MKMIRPIMLVLILSAASAALAQSGDPEAARAAFERGVAHMDAGHWQQALDAFQESIAAKPSQVAMLNAGRCFEELHRPREALAIYERFLANFAGEATAQRRAHAEARIQELRDAMGGVRIIVNRAGAEVSVDGEVVGRSPIAEDVMLPAGRHAVSARLAGIPVAAAAAIDVRAGARTEVMLTLQEPTAEPPDRPGSDETPVGAGAGGGEGEEPDHVDTPSEPVDRSGLRPVWFWGAASLAAAGAVATGILGTMVVIEDGEYEDDAARTREDQDAGKDLVRATDIALGVTLAAAVGAVILFTQTDFGGGEPERARAPSLGVAVAPGSASLTVGATF